MNNIILIAYNGRKPSKREVEELSSAVTGQVEMIKHYDLAGISETIAKSFGKVITLRSEKDKALENAAIFINAHYKSPWDLLGDVAIARKVGCRTEEQDALLSAIDIIADNSAEKCCEYAISSIMHNACYNVKHHILNVD